jgi:hypothetical protein
MVRGVVTPNPRVPSPTCHWVLGINDNKDYAFVNMDSSLEFIGRVGRARGYMACCVGLRPHPLVDEAVLLNSH